MDFLNLKPGLSQVDIDNILNTYPLDRVQIDDYIDENSLRLLNQQLFTARPDVAFRIYGHPFKDMSFISSLTNVRKLCLDCMYDAVENLDVLGKLTYLEDLRIDIYNQKDFSFLEKITDNLKKLSLNANKTSLDANKLLRFGGLEWLDIQDMKKNIHVIAELKGLKYFRIKGITASSLEFINSLHRLQELHIYGGKNDLTVLYSNKNIQHLLLSGIKGLDNLDLITSLPNLESVKVQYISDITSLPDLSENHFLKDIELMSMKNLTDLSTAQFAPALEEFEYSCVSKELKPLDILPVIKNTTLKKCRIFFPSDKKNKEADSLCIQYGKSFN